MCAADRTRRPTNRQVAARITATLDPPTPPPPPQPSAPASGRGAALGGMLLFTAALAGLAALAGGDSKWDRGVRRYRGSDGKFTTG
jgi:hypothetical protein